MASNETPSVQRVDAAAASAAHWLEALQRSDGGWPTLEGGKSSSIMNSAESMLALSAAGMAPGHQVIRDGVRFLLSHQICSEPGGGSGAAWGHAISLHGGSTTCVPDVVRTAFALRCLATMASHEEDAIARGVVWLQGRQETDGGWAVRAGASSETLPTCFALMALLEVHHNASEDARAELRRCIENGVNHLVKNRPPGQRYFGTGGAPHAISTIFALLVLAAACDNGFVVAHDAEDAAVGWLIEHPSEAIRPVEIEFQIAGGPGAVGNYRFLFMSESLLVRLFAASGSRYPGLRDLAKTAMIRIGENREDRTGAFYGRRVFSWSTAKVLMALCAVESEFPTFPRETPPPPRAPGWLQPVLLSLLAAVIVLVVVVELAGEPSVEGIGGIIALALLAVLVGGFISERTLIKLFPKLGRKGN